jgi:hypothetical protein
MIKLLVACVPFFFLLHTSCGYRLSLLEETKKPLGVPYIKGDEDGLFTRILINTLSESGKFTYFSHGAENELVISILSDCSQHIGYRYDREEITGDRINRLEPIEGRRTVVVEIKVIRANTQEILFGPIQLTSKEDYDFVDQDSAVDVSFVNPLGTRLSVLNFSLGQLDSEEGAKFAALRPLYEKLSKKIIDILFVHL